MGERLNGVEALMWAAEADPMLRSDFLAVTMLDRAPDRERMLDRLAVVADAIPRLGQRVVTSRVPGRSPEWCDADDFSVADHVHEVSAPSRTSHRRELDLAAEIGDRALDRTRPMWRMTIVTGLPRGRAMMVHHLDHVVADGMGAVHLALAMLDLERDPPPKGDRHRGSRSLRPDPPRNTAAPKGLRDLMRDAFAQTMTVQRKVAERSLEATIAALRDPDRAAETVRSVRSQLLVRDPARSPVMTARSGSRHLDTFSVPLADAKASAVSLGGTLNDWFVTGLSGALARYHAALEGPCDELRMAMPVSLREAGNGAGAGNQWANARVLIPLTPADPRARHAAIKERLAAVRKEPALALTEDLADLAARVPGPVLRRAARQQVATVDFAASNVPGPPMTVYFAGSRLDATYPMGPLGGSALNVTLASYRDRVDLGIVTDTAAVTDPARLLRNLRSSFRELLALG